MEITAAVTEQASARFELQHVQLSEVREDEVLVRIAAVGICHTDLAARDQHIPFPLPGVLGHEGAGVVEEVGSRVTKVKPGDHVALSWLSCGECAHCKSGQAPYCTSFLALNFGGTRADGSVTMQKEGRALHGSFFGQSSFASHALATERNVVKVPAELPLEIVGPLGCGIQTGAGAVMNALRVEPGSSIAVFGAGTVGMSAILAALVSGCTTIVAVDVYPNRLELARELGATHAVNVTEVDPVERIRTITDGGVNYSLECVGSPAVFRQATDVLPLLGECGLVGAVAPGTEVTLDMDRIMNGRRVRGIIEGDAIPDVFIPKLIELRQQGRFPFERLMSFFDFDDINKAVTEMEDGRVIKPILRVSP